VTGGLDGLPLREVLGSRGDRPQLGLGGAVGRDEDLNVAEKARHALTRAIAPLPRVGTQVSDGLTDRWLTISRWMPHDCKRQAIHEQYIVEHDEAGPTVERTVKAEVLDNPQVVALRDVPVDQLDRPAPATIPVWSTIYHDTLQQQFGDSAVRVDQIGRGCRTTQFVADDIEPSPVQPRHSLRTRVNSAEAIPQLAKKQFVAVVLTAICRSNGKRVSYNDLSPAKPAQDVGQRPAYRSHDTAFFATLVQPL
jgi:hypothetical protein